jgi:hypothetical protein
MGSKRGGEQPSRRAGSPGAPKGGLRVPARRRVKGASFHCGRSKGGRGQGALRGGDVGVADNRGRVAGGKLNLESACRQGGGTPGAGGSKGAHSR